MKSSERVIAERDRLVAWVLNDNGERVTLQPGDRIKFVYKDKDRLGTVLGSHRGGFRLREDGDDPRPKMFSRERVSGFSFQSSETQV